MKQIDLREGAKRQHRAIALFAVIQCWIKDLDGLAFERLHLERLLGLERFKQTRVTWLLKDMEDFFPYRDTTRYSGRIGSFASLIVCRRPFEELLPSGTMSIEQRIAGIPKEGPRIGIFEMWSRPRKRNVMAIFENVVPFFADSANYDERFLSAYLALLCAGQISPRSLPPVKTATKGTEA